MTPIVTVRFHYMNILINRHFVEFKQREAVIFWNWIYFTVYSGKSA